MRKLSPNTRRLGLLTVSIRTETCNLSEVSRIQMQKRKRATDVLTSVRLR